MAKAFKAGTWVPWLAALEGRKIGIHTSLGEESAEAVVGVGLLALLSEVSIGLSAMLVVDTRFPPKKRGVSLNSRLGATIAMEFQRTWMPCSRQYSCTVL